MGPGSCSGLELTFRTSVKMTLGLLFRIAAKPALRWLRHEGPPRPVLLLNAIKPLDVGKAVNRIFVGHLTGIRLTAKRESHCGCPPCARSGRSQISIKPDPDRFGARPASTRDDLNALSRRDHLPARYSICPSNAHLTGLQAPAMLSARVAGPRSSCRCQRMNAGGIRIITIRIVKRSRHSSRTGKSRSRNVARSRS
jgi:hypothetical protein